MNRFSSPLARILLGAAATSLAAAWAPPRADTIVRKNGSRVEGKVSSVDADSVIVETSTGPQTLPRTDVASIAFGGSKPLKVEIKNVQSDDAVDVSVDGDEVIRSASTGGEWVDITGKLKEGNNALRLRIHNGRGVWAYRLILRVNGQSTPIECGKAQVYGQGCKAGGRSGDELGVIDDLPELWLSVDRSAGRAEILP